MRGLRVVISCVTLVASLSLPPMAISAEVGIELARSRQCLACHQVDSKRVGPAFMVVASRYADVDGAAAYLADTIRHGSRQKWGAVPMPAQPQVSPTDAALLADWILSLPPAQ